MISGISTLSDPTKDEVVDLLAKLSQKSKAILLVGGERLNVPKEEWSQILKTTQVPIFGGLFPKVILKGKNSDTGMIGVGLRENAEVAEIDGLDDFDIQFQAQLLTLSEKFHRATTIVVFVDGRSQRVGEFIEAVYDVLGSNHTYIGAGAGSLAPEQSACIFSNGSCNQGKAVLIAMETNMEVSLGQGWERLAGPFSVTRSEKNKIIDIDYEPALQMYLKTIKKKTSEISNASFADFANSYPFGLLRFDGSHLVRTPILTDGKSITCIGEIPTNSIIYLLTSSRGLLTRSAKEAADDLHTRSPSSSPFLIDCISRAQLLGETYSDFLTAISENGSNNKRPLVGVLGLGEIANQGTSALELYNNTLVIAGF